MPHPQGLVSFSNVQQIESFTYTLSHGITPGQAVLRIEPQPGNIQVLSGMVLSFGGSKFVLRDCLADQASYQFNQQGYLVSLTILDRRWKWAFPRISGHYNVRDKNANIVKDEEKGQQPAKDDAIADTERTPQELAKLCLEAMGEQNYIVTDMPNDLRPGVHWENFPAAHALQQICDAVGCSIVLQLDNRVAIRKLGVGRALPNGPVMDQSASLDPPNRPSELIVRCGPTQYQDDMELEAVALQRDGKVVLADDVDYKPAGGWGDSDWSMGDIATDQTRALALQSVFRWYRVKTPLKLNGYDGGEIERLRQILPLGTQQIFTHRVLDNLENRAAIVWGVDWVDEEGLTEPTTAIGNLFDYVLERSIVPYSFTMDTARGIVKFNQPVYALDDNDDFAFPVLKLRTAAQVRDKKTGAWERYERKRVLDPRSKTKPRVVVIEELSLHYANGKTHNKAEIDKQLDKYLDAFEQEYRLQQASGARYSGWLKINPDGALRSITWDVNQGGAFTTVQRNDDQGSPTTQPENLRRLHEAYQRAMYKAAELDRERRLIDAPDEKASSVSSGGPA